MNDRLQQILDGEQPTPPPSQGEASEAAQAAALISSVLRSIPTQPLPDLAASVLQRIEATPHVVAPRAKAAAGWRRLSGWLWSPRPVQLAWRPAYAFALALVFAAGALMVDRLSTTQAITPQQILVQFRLDAPQASRVALAGNFTNWQPSVQLTRSAGGVWVAVVPLERGVHNYAFVVDGDLWQPDPMAPAVSDGFGGENSQIAVLPPDAVVES